MVLDNCEHLIDACAELGDTLLSVCPRLHILAVTAAVRRWASPARWLIACPRWPILTPPIASRPGAGRVRGARPLNWRRPSGRDSNSAEQNATAVAQIVRRLDGIPLAIELAAARMKALQPRKSPNGWTAPLLSADRRQPHGPAPPADAAGDDRLELRPAAELERRPLRLAVFRGGWTLEAARK